MPFSDLLKKDPEPIKWKKQEAPEEVEWESERPKSSLSGAFGRGLASAATQMASSIGTLGEYAGSATGSDWLKERGKETRTFWEDVGKDYEPYREIQGSIIEKPALLKDPTWWVYNLTNVGASFLPGLVTGLGAAKYIKVLGEAIPLTEKVVNRLAKLGAMAGGGLVGGLQEGTSTRDEVIKRGGTEEDANRAMEAMTLATGALNSLSMGKLFDIFSGKAGKGLIRNFLEGGITEAVTEYAEEPAEVAIKSILLNPEQFSSEEAVEQLIQGLNVVPPTLIVGGLTGAVGGGRMKTPENLEGRIVNDFRRYVESGVTLADATERKNQLAAINPALADTLNQAIIDAQAKKLFGPQTPEEGPATQTLTQTIPEPGKAKEDEAIKANGTTPEFTFKHQAQEALENVREQIKALDGKKGGAAIIERNALKSERRRLKDLVSTLPEYTTRSGGVIEKSVKGTGTTPGFEPSVEVPGEPTPDMGPDALGKLKGVLYGKTGRFIEQPAEEVAEEDQEPAGEIEEVEGAREATEEGGWLEEGKKYWDNKEDLSGYLDDLKHDRELFKDRPDEWVAEMDTAIQAIETRMKELEPEEIEWGEGKKEDPRWAAIGAISGGKVRQIEERGFKIVWAKGPVNPMDLVGPINGYDARKLAEMGLTYEKTVPTEEKHDVVKEIQETKIEDLDNIIDEVAAEKAKGEKAPVTGGPRTPKEPGTPKGPQKRTTRDLSDILGSAASHGVKGADKALSGLFELFGGRALRSGLGAIDEDTYKKAKPLFQEALNEWQAAGKDFRDFVKWVMDQFGNVGPYLKRFVREIQGTKEPEAEEKKTAISEKDLEGFKSLVGMKVTDKKSVFGRAKYNGIDSLEIEDQMKLLDAFFYNVTDENFSQYIDYWRENIPKEIEEVEGAREAGEEEEAEEEPEEAGEEDTDIGNELQGEIDKGKKKEKKKRVKKLEDVGEKRWKRSNQEHKVRKEAIVIELDKEITETDPDKIYAALKRMTERSKLLPLEIPKEATPGTTRFLNSFRNNISGWMEYVGGKLGGSKRKYGTKFEEAIKESGLSTPETKKQVMEATAQYISTLELLEEAVKGSVNVSQARDAIIKFLIKDEVYKKWDLHDAQNINNLSANPENFTEAGNNLRDYLRNRMSWYSIQRFVTAIADNNYILTENEQDKEQPIVRIGYRLMDIETTGKHRDGKDVTGQDLVDTFALGTVAFGDWTEGAHRQKSVNLTFDSLWQLSEMIGAPVKGVSYNSEKRLGIMFGARGRGGRAAATFHPEDNTINLTKTKGDGSLAHEWAHGLDDYSKLDMKNNVNEAYRDYTPFADLKHALNYKYTLENLDKIVDDLLRGLHYTSRAGRSRLEEAKKFLQDEWEATFVEKTQFWTDAKKLDGGKQDKYWSQSLEMFARAFEAYVADTLEEQNLYLVDPNFTAPGAVEAMFNRSASPYPNAKERERFNKLFEKFFAGIEWTEDGIPSMKPDYVPVTLQEKLTTKEELDKVIAKLEDLYKAIYSGEPSEDGLWWYGYKDTHRGPMMQPNGFMAYDEEVKPTSGDGKGAVGYPDALHPDDIVKFGLYALKHEKTDKTIYLEEPDHGTTPTVGTAGEDALGEASSDDGEKPEGGWGVSGPTDRGSGAGGEGTSGSQGEQGDGLGSGLGEGNSGVDISAPGGRSDYTIRSTLNLDGRTPTEIFSDNLAAIRTLKQIESEKRLATPEEQDILAKYAGWGPCPGAVAQSWSVPDAWKSRNEMVKGILTPDELDDARRSTMDAYYTPVAVYDAIYRALAKFGWKGGRVLSGSCGVGREFGTMPEDVRKLTQITGVEMDSISARIAAQLYQNQRVINSPFEDVALPENFFDLNINNVPFGDSTPSDKKHNPLGFHIHDYFINKGIDTLRPGGIMAVLTSTGTMDKSKNDVRQLFSEKADFIGAIRLPNGIFTSAQAGSDIIFLRKKGEFLPEIPKVDWVDTVSTQLPEVDSKNTVTTYKTTVNVNQYFKDRPEMILGTMAYYYGAYRGSNIRVVGTNKNIGDQIDKAAENLPANLYEEQQVGREMNLLDSLAKAGEVKDGAFFVGEDGKLYVNEAGTPVEYDIKTQKGKDRAAIIRALIPIRDTVRSLLRAHAGDTSKGTREALRKQLNKQYDEFVKKFGYINRPMNVRAISEDPDSGVLLALEKWDEDTESFKGKEAIFTENYMEEVKPPTSAKNASEALIYSMNWKGRIDLGYISSLTGLSRDRVIEDLKGKIYNDPERGHVTADEYLSGNVRQKLEAAKNAAKVDKQYADNVVALTEVQPVNLEPHEIRAKLGSSFIPVEYIRDFMRELMGYHADHVKVDHIPDTGSWYVTWTGRSDAQAKRNKAAAEKAYQATNEWGTEHVNFYDLMEFIMNGGFPKVMSKPDRDGRRHFKQKETDAAIFKMTQIADRFQSWIWESDERTARVVKDYNEMFNSYVDRQFDGSHLTFPGKVPDAIVKLRPHQVNAVWRFLQTGVAYFGHEVGTGKTYTMIAALMEARRLGLARKPMLSIKKATINDFKTSFQKLYPGAKVLYLHVPGNANKRKRVLSRAATGDYDAIVVTHESFMKIPLKTETLAITIQDEVRKLEAALYQAQASGAARYTVMEIERQKRKLEDSLKDLMKKPKDDIPTLEEIGVDLISIDEAHAYKNLMFATRYGNVKGLKSGEADRSMDLLSKTNYIRNRFGRGIIFASGTPLTNSVGEAYTLSRYLQPQELKARGIENFDAWANTFGIIANEAAPTVTGAGYQSVNRFTRFVNMPEMMQMIRQVLDVIKVGEEEKPGMIRIPRPNIKGGKPISITLKQNDQVKAHQQELLRRAYNIKLNGQKAEYEGVPDNMLRLIDAGRKMAMDPRMYNAKNADEEETKINRAVKNIAEIYKQELPAYDWDTGTDYIEKKGVQLVFIDMGVPGGGIPFNAYEDIRKKLKKAGIPEKEIAFIHDIGTGPQAEKKRGKLFAKVRSGAIRVLIGSTPKMGLGVNVQTRVVAHHHLDVDWNYANYEQRNGRGVRFGNNAKDVAIYNYGTEGTVDAFMWDAVARKAKVLGQVLSLDNRIREVEDISKDTMTAQEFVMELSGNPLQKEKIELERSVRQLRNAKAEYDYGVRRARGKIVSIPGRIESLKGKNDDYRKYIALLETVNSIQIGEEFFVLAKKGAEANAAGEKVVKDKELVSWLNEKPDRRKVVGQFGHVEEEEVNYIEEKKVKDKEGKEKVEKVEKKKKVQKFIPTNVWLKAYWQIFGEQVGYELVTNLGGNTDHEVSHGIARTISNSKSAAERIIERNEQEIDALTKELPVLQAKVDKPFEKQDELLQKEVRLHAVTQELLAKQDEENAKMAAQMKAKQKEEAKFYIRTNDGKFEPVDGVEVDLAPFIEAFAHEVEDGKWVVTELTSGRRLIDPKESLEDAITEAKSQVERMGEERVRSIIEKAIQQSGRSPSAKKPETQLSLSALSPTLTSKQAWELRQLTKMIKGWLSDVLPKEVVDKINLELGPFVNLSGKDIEESLRQYGPLAVQNVLGATTVGNMEALIQMAYGYDKKTLSTTAYHEAFHVAAKWVLPRESYDYLVKYYETEEAAAEAFGNWVGEAKGRLSKLRAEPSKVRIIFLKLKRIFQIIRNGLQGKGFRRPEDIFARLLLKDYRPHYAGLKGKGTRVSFREDKRSSGLMKTIRSLQPAGQPRALVSISALRDKADMPQEDFDKALLSLAQEGKIALHQHDFPSSLKPEKRAKLLAVKDPNAYPNGIAYYVGVVPKGEETSLEGDTLLRLETNLNNERLKDEIDAIGKTILSMMPKNQPYLNAAEKLLKSPEWWEHPQLKRIVRLFTRTRTELFHRNFNDLMAVESPFEESETVLDAAKDLKNKGLSLKERLAGKTSKEYKDLLWAIDYGDTGYKRNTDLPLDEQLEAYEKVLKDKGLSDDTIKVWKLYRESYDKALDMMTAQLRQMIEQLQEKARWTGEDVDTSELRKTLKGALAQMEKWKGFYAPRIRERGNWVIQGTKGAGPGEEHYRAHKGSRYAAERHAKQLKREGWGNVRVTELSRLPEEVYKDLKTVSVAAAIEQALKDMQKKGKEFSDKQDAIVRFNEELLQNVADLIRARGFRSSMIHREEGEVVKGYIEDPIERHLIYTRNIAGGLSKAVVARDAMTELLGEYVKGKREGGIDPVKDHRAYVVGQDYIEEQLRNLDKGDQLVGLAKSIASFKFLGFSPRAAFVNLTATLTTAPVAIHQYVMEGKGSFWKINREIAKAGKDFAKFMAGKTIDNTLDQRFLEELKKSGYDDPQYVRDALGQLNNTSLKSWAKINDWAMVMFSKTEQWNRGTTMLAAFRLARKQGKPYEACVEAAREASDKAHGIYGRSTLPLWAIGRNPAAKIGQSMYTFSKFSHNYLQMMYDLGFSKGNVKGFLYGILSPVILGGLAAMPFKDVLFGITGWLLSLLGISDRDPEKFVWDQTRKHLGATAEIAGRHGLTGLLGADISGSLAIGVGLPRNLTELAGAPAGAISDIAGAAKYASRGQYGRVAEQVLPSGLANVARAFRESKEGLSTTKGYRVFDDRGKPAQPSGFESVLRGFGFRSSEKATMSERTWEAKREIGDFKDKRDAIYERYRAWIMGGRDEKEHKAILKAIREYNESVQKAGVSHSVPTIKAQQLRQQALNLSRARDKRLQAALQ